MKNKTYKVLKWFSRWIDLKAVPAFVDSEFETVLPFDRNRS